MLTDRLMGYGLRLAAMIVACTFALPALAAGDADSAPTQPAASTQPATRPATAANAGGVVGWLELDARLREGPVPFAWVSESDAGPSLAGVLSQLQTVAEKNRYRGLVIKLNQPTISRSQIEALHHGIDAVQEAGKKVIVFADTYDLRTYLLASAADQIVLQRGGTLRLSGVSLEEVYVAGLLKKIGVKPDLLQVGKFKGAKDNLTRNKPSKAWNKNISKLLDGLYEHTITTMAEGRGIDKAKMEQLMRRSWSMDAKACRRAGLIDRLANRDLVSVTEAAFGSDFVWDQSMGRSRTTQQAGGPFAFFRMLFQKPDVQTSGPTIAILHAEGPIVGGASARGQGLFAADTIGSQTMVKLLGRIERDPHIKGAILRVDSPGGSALASEIIWQALRQAANKKPIFISLGDMAASGGYYIAVGGDRIYAAASSIVGSIGVVGGKVALGGLYDKLGLNVVQRSRGPMAGIYNSSKPFTQKQRKAMRSALEQTYDQFIRRVRLGRGKRIDQIEKVAKGRVFTGEQALENGMVDRLGGMDKAIRQLAKKLDLKEGAYETLHLPAPMSLQAFLNTSFGGARARSGNPMGPADALTDAIETLKGALGRRRWRAAAPVLQGMLQLRRTPVLTLMPAALVVK